MEEFPAPGLPADWLNAWLAAIGVTVLCPNVRLCWSEAPRPCAVFHHEAGDLVETITAALPSTQEIADLAISRRGSQDFPRNVSLEVYRSRVARCRSGDWSLSSTITDLAWDKGGLAHSPFDRGASKGLTIWDRLVACRSLLGDDPRSRVAATLVGSDRSIRRRAKGNGLGFDHRRFLSPSHPVGDTWIDPVVETLAFIGLVMFPVRGTGARSHTRGWTMAPSKEGAFTWPVWHEILDSAAIDAMLDLHWNGPSMSGRITVYESVPYIPRGQMDQTRGYAARIKKYE